MVSCSMMLALCAMPPVQAQLILPPSDDVRPPSMLAPIDPASLWHARFSAAADELQPALARPGGQDWVPYFGGQWLGAADRARIAAILNDDKSAMRRTFAFRSASEFVVLGWLPPGGNMPYAALANRPEADAIVCWRNSGEERAWPTTAAEAEDVRAHACLRMSYSVRFDLSQWRAFMDAPLPRGD